ncbi:hypothetical protein Ddye_009441, partial [Dipteronia dyeriana]
QGIENRNAQERLQHFDETVSRYFDAMLDILYEMAKVMIKPLDPEFRSTPPEILSDSKYMSHFKMILRPSQDYPRWLRKLTDRAQITWSGKLADRVERTSSGPSDRDKRSMNGIRQLKKCQRDRDFDESENYLSEEVNEEMKVNTHEEDGPRRREMEMFKNVIAQSLMILRT